MQYSRFILPNRMIAYAVHQYLWGGFKQDKRDFLFQMTGYTEGVLLSHSPCDLPNTTPHTPDPLAKGEYDYRLTANPVFRSAEKRSHQLLTMPDDQKAWMQRKLGDTCLVQSFNAVPAETVRFRQATIQQVHMWGILTIEDPAKLSQIITIGIGRGKAFGCGLLLLTRRNHD